jgi:hypothetical protein
MPYLEKKEPQKLGTWEEPTKTPPPKVEKKDTSILEGKPYIPIKGTGGAVEKIKKGPAYTSFSGKKYSPREMEVLAKGVLKDAGSYYQRGERSPVLKILKQKLSDPKVSWKEKGEIKNQIKYFEKRL